MEAKMSENPKELNLAELCQNIQQIDLQIKASANRAINIHVTLRNWLVGAYIVHYELHGLDRAQYGEGTIQAIADRLDSKGFSKRNLNFYRQFYIVYPSLGSSLEQFLPNVKLSWNSLPEIGCSVNTQWPNLKAEDIIKYGRKNKVS